MRKWIIYVGIAGLLALLCWATQGGPVPKDQENWAAQGATPEQTALAFLSPPSEIPSITLMKRTEAKAKVRVSQSFPGDDSVASATYTIILQRTGNTWSVASASRHFTCKRGWSFRGSFCG